MQSDFGPRIRPEEITQETRDRLVRASYSRELFALCCVIVPTICVALMVSLGYRWHGEPPYTEWQSIYPILLTAVVLLFGVHGWFYRERRYLHRGPVAVATVKAIETSYDLTHAHRLVIKYKPDPTGAGLGREAQVVTVAIESDLKGFNDELHEGDALSIVYDPARPDHVRIVEEEHKL